MGESFRNIRNSGVGSPNGVVVGSPGDLYTDTAGGVGGTLWLKETGSGTNTGWDLMPTNAPATSWAQAVWFVDPANSTGFASDNNSGADAAHPVLSYNGGIVDKWGTTSPIIRQNTTLFWLSSQAGNSDPVVFKPIISGPGGALAAGFIVTILGLGPVYNSGAAASITAFGGGEVTLSGLAGMVASDVDNYLTITGATAPGNNGTFLITAFISATSVKVANAAGSSPDAGPLAWAVRYAEGTLLSSGALAGVVPKNRATPQLLVADIGFNPPGIGLAMIKNTTAGKTSLAYVNTHVAGTTYSFSQPMSPETLPVQNIGFTSEVDTWANGDSFQAFLPTAINVVEISPTSAVSDAPTWPLQVQVSHVLFTAIDGANFGRSIVTLGNSVAVSESIFGVILVDESTATGGGGQTTPATVYSNVMVTSGAFAYDAVFSTFGAGILGCPNGSAVAWSIDFDTIVTGTEIEFISEFASTTAPWIGLMNIGNTAGSFSVRVAGTRGFSGTVSASGASQVWGRGIVDSVGSARLWYDAAVGAAAATFTNTGGLKLNGQASANAFNPTTGLWSVLIPITAANLDLAFGAGGFGGLAMNLGGSSFTNQATP